MMKPIGVYLGFPASGARWDTFTHREGDKYSSFVDHQRRQRSRKQHLKVKKCTHHEHRGRAERCALKEPR